MARGQKMLKGFGYLLLLQFLGEWISREGQLPLPGNLVGLLLMFLMLTGGIIKEEDVAEAADFLMDHLVLFFVPLTVGIMAVFDLIRPQFLPIVASTVASTAVVLVVTGHAAQWIEKRKNHVA